MSLLVHRKQRFEHLNCLCFYAPADNLIWREERNGHFSVRSAYRMISRVLMPDQGESYTSQILPPLWKAIWKMRTPHKIKIFAWRACRNGLPSALNLARKHVKVAGNCIFCSSQVEGIAHAIFFCPSVRSWWSVYLPCSTDLEPNLNILDLSLSILSSKRIEGLTQFFVIAWGLRGRRNKHLFEGSVISPHTVIENALAYHNMFTECLVLPAPNLEKFGHWFPPENNKLKLNVDGALFNDFQVAGVGAILRDFRGDVLVASSMKVPGIQDLETVEMLAVLRGLQACLPLGVSQLCIESDRKLVVQAIQQKEVSDSLLGNNLYDILELMSNFQDCSINFSHRCSNAAAHCLARYACNVPHIVIWQGAVLDFLNQTIWFDKACCNQTSVSP